MMIERKSNNVNNWLIWTGTFLLVTITTWVLLLILTFPEGSLERQLVQLADQPLYFQFTFINASVIAPAVVVLMILLALFTPEESNTFAVSEIVSVIFLAPYLLLTSVAYTSQFAFLPKLVRSISNESMDYILLWYFNNPDSMIYFFDVLGYTFFGFSAVLIGLKCLKYSRLLKGIGATLLVSGLLAIAGFIGYSLEIVLLETGILVSGILIVPLVILVIIVGIRQKRLESLYV